MTSELNEKQSDEPNHPPQSARYTEGELECLVRLVPPNSAPRARREPDGGRRAPVRDRGPRHLY